VEGSTRLLHELGPERYAVALAAHRRVLREAFERHPAGGGRPAGTRSSLRSRRRRPQPRRRALRRKRSRPTGPVRVRRMTVDDIDALALGDLDDAQRPDG
jgi:hypothetical protein